MSMKRVLAMLLAIVMVVGMIPAPAYATTGTEEGEGAFVPEVEVVPGESVPEGDIVAPEEPGYPVMTVGERSHAKVSGGSLTYFSFMPETTCSYTFSSRSVSDTYGYLYDSEMNELTYNDNGNVNNNFSITYQLTAGETYILGVRFYQQSESKERESR